MLKIGVKPPTTHLITFIYIQGSSVGEWLGHSLAVLGVDGSSLLTASKKM